MSRLKVEIVVFVIITTTLAIAGFHGLGLFLAMGYFCGAYEACLLPFHRDKKPSIRGGLIGLGIILAMIVLIALFSDGKSDNHRYWDDVSSWAM